MSEDSDSGIFYTCDRDNETNIGVLSTLCTNGSYNYTQCIPNIEEQAPYRIALGVWGSILMLFGVFGNIFTLLAIPYASKRRR